MHIAIVASRSMDNSDYSFWRPGPDGRGIARVASSAIATVAAMVPSDFEISLIDESVDRFDVNSHGGADIYAITATVGQASQAIRLAQQLRGMGKTVVMGGPHISLAPHLFEAHADCLVIGEVESVAEEFFGDLRSGRLKRRYVAGKADMKCSPKPRWDLYPNDKAYLGVVQTSRGCPFECHFCDVIQYLGRVQRHKAPDQVVGELQQLYDLGYSHVFLADDNFTVYRKRARALLEVIAAWNGKDGRGYQTYYTQMSIDVAKDPELVSLCAEAGLVSAFFGIETNNEESLLESKKRQNTRVDLVEQIESVVAQGVRVEAGLMVGFDHDDHSIFEKLFAFTRRLPVGHFNVSCLVAPVATPLYDDMMKSGRVVTKELMSQFPAYLLVSNIQPAQMSREDLYIGARWLMSKIYHPESFYERFVKLAEIIAPAPWERPGNAPRKAPRPGLSRFNATVFREQMRDPLFRSVAKQVMALMKQRPDIQDTLGSVFGGYVFERSNRRAVGLYDDTWAEMDAPPFGADEAQRGWREAVQAIAGGLEHTRSLASHAAE